MKTFPVSSTLRHFLQSKLIGFFLIFSLCLFGAYHSYRNSDFAAAPALLSSASRALSSNVYLTSSEDIHKAFETGIREYDPYFSLIDSDEDFKDAFSAFTSKLTAKYGIRFDPETGEISTVMKHSPASQVLQQGDIIMSVNGNQDPSVFLEVFSLSNSVTIQYLRDHVPGEVQVSSEILQPAYCELTKDGIGKITIYFIRPEIIINIKEFLYENQAVMQELHFDLSQCPGGRVQTLVSLLSLLLPSDTGVFVEKRSSSTKIHVTGMSPALNLDLYDKLPITILKSEVTASSAEIFAGVLKHRYPDRVSLVGPKTFGKWTTIQPVKFLKGGMVSSIGRVFLMDGTTYEGIGL